MKIAAGDNFLLALRTDGTVWSWGENQQGQLGDGTLLNRLAPQQILGLANVVDIAAGGGGNRAYVTRKCFAVTADGKLFGWGDNTSGSLGTGDSPVKTTNPTRVVTDQFFARVETSGLHTIALTQTGKPYAWGQNYSGQLGLGSKSQPVGTPTAVVGLDEVTEFDAGLAESLFITSDTHSYVAGTTSRLIKDGTAYIPKRITAVPSLRAVSSSPLSPESRASDSATYVVSDAALPFLAEFDTPTLVWTYGRATLTLRTAKPPATNVALAVVQDPPGQLVMPASIVFPAGRRKFAVAVDALPIPDQWHGFSTVTLKAPEGNAAAVSIELYRPSAYLRFDEPFYSGERYLGKVILSNFAAPKGGLTLNLGQDAPLLGLPADVAVPAGTQEKTLTIVMPERSDQIVTYKVSTEAPSISIVQEFMVRPIKIKDLIVSPETITGGKSITLTVRLYQPMPRNVDVLLSSSHPSTVPVPAKLRIKAGAVERTITINTTATANAVDATLLARFDANDFGRKQVVHILPFP